MTIDAQAINKIKDFGVRRFHAEISLPSDPKEAQIFLVLAGLEDFLRTQGIEPNFTVKTFKENPSGHTPLDDLG